MSDPCATTPRVPLVAIERARVDIEGHRVLEDVDWSIHRGEHWGVVGANGSGKSTLLRLLEGTLWPVPGHGRRRYDFGDGPQTDAIQARTRIVTVGPELQNRYARFGWNFRVVDVVRSGITRSDVPRRNPPAAESERARRIIAELGLGALADRRFLELSRGQQRRVLIARALGFAPALLLLDEPASGLDAAARADLDTLLAGVAGHTTLVVTAHSVEDLPAAVTAVAEVADGTLKPVAAAGLRPRPSAGPANDAAMQTDNDTCGVRAPLIEVRNASVYFDGKAVLRGVDWTLRPGEHWLITGHNGSGKSTFLRLLHGQLRPAVGGTVTWPGLGDPANVWALRRQVGLVSAELLAAYRYPVSVHECIASGIESSFGLTRRLTGAEAARVEALTARFALGDLASRRLTALSYGQLHRTMIARTLINAPRLLLLDEPWEGLDPATRSLVAGVLNQARAEGTQIVCASHIDEPGLAFNRRGRLDGGVLSDAYAGA